MSVDSLVTRVAERHRVAVGDPVGVIYGSTDIDALKVGRIVEGSFGPLSQFRFIPLTGGTMTRWEAFTLSGRKIHGRVVLHADANSETIMSRAEIFVDSVGDRFLT